MIFVATRQTACMETAVQPTLPATLRMGAVHLIVADVDRSVAWYQEVLGLRVMRHDVDEAELGDGTAASVVLHEDSQAGPAGGRHAGLYHYALLFASREELARAALRVSAARAPIQGASDHGTHEAIYLADPDGIGIELAADRPRDRWPTPEEEFGGGGPRPLDLESLLATVASEQPPAHVGEGLRVGHVHLHVGDIERGLAFYRDLLGFEVWFVMPTAAFVAAGGYHHHLGFNTWQGRAIGPAAPHVQLDTSEQIADVRARFEAAGVPVADAEHGFAVRDPWATELRLEGAE
jgi:catechol 2,3-dioxygenase